jgi:hypothetical protein
LLLFFVFFAFAQQVPQGTVVVGAFTRYNNDSLAKIAPNGTVVAKNPLGEIIESYSNVVLDPKARRLYCLGVSDQPWFDVYDADTLQQIGSEIWIPTQWAIIDIQYDTVWNKLVGITSNDEGDFIIAEFNLTDGSQKQLVVLEDVVAIDEYSQAYDSKTHRYYVAGLMNEPNPCFMLVYNLATRTFEKRIQVPDFIQNSDYDSVTDHIVGVYNDTFAVLDVNTGKLVVYTKTLDFNPIGFRELSAGTVDPAGGYYYVLYENHKAQTTWIQVNMRKLSYKAFPFYNHIGIMQYVPPQ